VIPVGQIASVNKEAYKGRNNCPQEFQAHRLRQTRTKFFPGVCLDRRPYLQERLRDDRRRKRRSAASLWRCCGAKRKALCWPAIKITALFVIVRNMMTMLIFDNAARDYGFKNHFTLYTFHLLGALMTL
jgi:hypothetical protein